ncbi:hypothetical protein AYK24_10125 [Thermoplasmatales archaeon SG8-52-4]|nr:MAG: hypothetical protein AYK24_10125 [Thermoplasmatales archaeon SG8-52-4]
MVKKMANKEDKQDTLNKNESKKLNDKKKTNSPIEKNKIKQKSIKKKYKLLVSIVIIICIIGFVWLVFNTIFTEDKVKAQLIIESGIVKVKHGGSWTIAENGMDLYESDSIRTEDNSSASIILFKSSVIRLDKNSEVTIKELIRDEETTVTIQQDSGRTWNAVTKISGIDNYEVQTPTTIASVRGTAFVVIVQENGSSYYGVSHGVLNVSGVSKGVIKGSIDVSGNESVFVFIDLINETLKKKPFEMDEWVIENLLKDKQFVEDFKQELYARIEEYIPALKAEYGISDQELDTLLEGYILGYFDIPEDAPKWIKDLFKLS